MFGNKILTINNSSLFKSYLLFRSIHWRHVGWKLKIKVNNEQYSQQLWNSIMFDKVSQESKLSFILNSGYSWSSFVLELMFSCFIKLLDNAFLLSSTALADFTGFYIKDCFRRTYLHGCHKIRSRHRVKVLPSHLIAGHWKSEKKN